MRPQRSREMLSVTSIAHLLGVKPSTVHQWIKRGQNPESDWPPFPEPDGRARTANPDLFILVWELDREPELREYKKLIDARPGHGWRRGKTGDIAYTALRRKDAEHDRAT